MARENTVILHGQVRGKPKIYINKEGQRVQASFFIKVMRRPFLSGEGQTNIGKLRVDSPPIITRDPEIIDKCLSLESGDMVDIKGVLVTRNVKKEAICPNGHHVVNIGTNVFVVPIYVCRRESALSVEQGDILLRNRCEVSNICMIIGSVCRTPQFYEFVETEGGCVAQYQIASNRRYHIRDGHEEERTDYPWVKTINKQARDDAEHLVTGSTVYINGAIQTREIERQITCPECKATFQKKEMVCELFPYGVEYLMGCIFPPKPESEKAEGEEE